MGRFYIVELPASSYAAYIIIFLQPITVFDTWHVEFGLTTGDYEGDQVFKLENSYERVRNMALVKNQVRQEIIDSIEAF